MLLVYNALQTLTQTLKQGEIYVHAILDILQQMKACAPLVLLDILEKMERFAQRALPERSNQMLDLVLV